jgi:hypothetical protein
MIKKTVFLLSLVVFLFFGIGIDLLRTSLLANTGTINNQFPFLLLYDVVVDILYVLVVFWLIEQVHRNSLSKTISVFILLAGLYIVCIPLLSGTILVPSNLFSHSFNSYQTHRNFAGAIIFVIGVANVFRTRKLETETHK